MKHTARLAMLEGSDGLDFDAMVKFAGEMPVAPSAMARPNAQEAALREDIPGESLPVEDVLRNAKASQDGMIAVPAVL